MRYATQIEYLIVDTKCLEKLGHDWCGLFVKNYYHYIEINCSENMFLQYWIKIHKVKFIILEIWNISSSTKYTTANALLNYLTREVLRWKLIHVKIWNHLICFLVVLVYSINYFKPFNFTTVFSWYISAFT